MVDFELKFYFVFFKYKYLVINGMRIERGLI